MSCFRSHLPALTITSTSSVKYFEALSFGYTVLNDCHLYLFGGDDLMKESLRWVMFYRARTNKWFKGECKRIQRILRSAEIYDLIRNRWNFIEHDHSALYWDNL